MLGKRKTGADDAPSQLEIIAGLSHDMRVAYNIKDYAAADRVYDRFLSVVEPKCLFEGLSQQVRYPEHPTVDKDLSAFFVELHLRLS
jgi:hypothetical protein